MNTVKEIANPDVEIIPQNKIHLYNVDGTLCTWKVRRVRLTSLLKTIEKIACILLLAAGTGYSGLLFSAAPLFTVVCIHTPILPALLSLIAINRLAIYLLKFPSIDYNDYLINRKNHYCAEPAKAIQFALKLPDTFETEIAPTKTAFQSFLLNHIKQLLANNPPLKDRAKKFANYILDDTANKLACSEIDNHPSFHPNTPVQPPSTPDSADSGSLSHRKFKRRSLCLKRSSQESPRKNLASSNGFNTPIRNSRTTPIGTPSYLLPRPIPLPEGARSPLPLQLATILPDEPSISFQESLISSSSSSSTAFFPELVPDLPPAALPSDQPAPAPLLDGASQDAFLQEEAADAPLAKPHLKKATTSELPKPAAKKVFTDAEYVEQISRLLQKEDYYHGLSAYVLDRISCERLRTFQSLRVNQLNPLIKILDERNGALKRGNPVPENAHLLDLANQITTDNEVIKKECIELLLEHIKQIDCNKRFNELFDDITRIQDPILANSCIHLLHLTRTKQAIQRKETLQVISEFVTQIETLETRTECLLLLLEDLVSKIESCEKEKIIAFCQGCNAITQEINDPARSDVLFENGMRKAFEKQEMDETDCLKLRAMFYAGSEEGLQKLWSKCIVSLEKEMGICFDPNSFSYELSEETEVDSDERDLKEESNVDDSQETKALSPHAQMLQKLTSSLPTPIKDQASLAYDSQMALNALRYTCSEEKKGD